MDYFPIFVRINTAPVLVVGGGDSAATKISLLLKTDARITVIAPTFAPRLVEWGKEDKIRLVQREFSSDDVTGQHLVFVATDDANTRRAAAEHAQKQRIPVNVVDHPTLSSFIMPALVDRSPVIVAISTGGSAPVLARQIRAQIETVLPAGLGRLARLAGAFREEVKRKISAFDTRRKFWERVFEGNIAELIYRGKEQAARDALKQTLDASESSARGPGEVYLVGSGPGDPELLTMRAFRLMQKADVVVHDRLVTEAILDLCRRDAERIYAGKQRGDHVIPQEGINTLLVRLAKQGKRVLRLKGGDPFIFGRGGEEIETLAAQNIPFQVVPGITAASGCAAYAGIPLTHRDYAQSCTFVTGHLKDGQVNLDWDRLIQPNHTVVIYMGLIGLPIICAQLVARGLPASTPAALIEQGTTEHHRVLIGTLETLPGQVEAASPRPPTLIIVGDVVKLHRDLNWFSAKS